MAISEKNTFSDNAVFDYLSHRWHYRKKSLFPIMPSSTVLAIGGIIGKSFFPIMPKTALSEKNGSFGPSVGKVSCLTLSQIVTKDSLGKRPEIVFDSLG